jgi:hypothetical protein
MRNKQNKQNKQNTQNKRRACRCVSQRIEVSPKARGRSDYPENRVGVAEGTCTIAESVVGLPPS